MKIINTEYISKTFVLIQMAGVEAVTFLSWYYSP